MRLTACLLTRNEEQNIARALRSLAGVADQVVVVDTASTDQTAQRAARLGAEVHQFDWQDDFAAGRNFALQQSRGDWILWLQADEEMLPPKPDSLEQALGEESVFGYFVRVQNVLSADRPDVYSETMDLRLFRRRPDARFVGRLHPRFVDDFVETVRREGKQVRPSVLTLRSYAALAPRTEAKLRWTARLLELELQDRPGQLHYLIEYGRVLLILKDARGQDVLTEAAAQVSAARDAPRAPNHNVQVLLEYALTVAPELPGLPRDQARALALRWFPDSPPLLYLNAEQAFDARDYRAAANLLERLVELGRTGAYDKSRRFDPGLIGAKALLNLAACYRQLGEPQKAEECARRAKELAAK